jgi:hypothetical protein
MRKQFFLLFCACLVTAAAAEAQTRTVTNADLEKFRQKRIQAEREYRENYAKLGLPSPEELDRRREQSRIDNERLSARFRAERIENERLELQQERADRERQTIYWSQQFQTVPGFDGGYYYSFPLSFGRFGNWRPASRAGYFAGGHFWETPIQRPAPRFNRPPIHRGPRH